MSCVIIEAKAGSSTGSRAAEKLGVMLSCMYMLQGVQNCLARVVTKSPRFCHITPLLKSLHWLPVRYRMKFKLCFLTYQALPS